MLVPRTVGERSPEVPAPRGKEGTGAKRPVAFGVLGTFGERSQDRSCTKGPPLRDRSAALQAT
eukprot:2526579-Alexandrium_andersonii.AAC.1